MRGLALGLRSSFSSFSSRGACWGRIQTSRCTHPSAFSRDRRATCRLRLPSLVTSTAVQELSERHYTLHVTHLQALQVTKGGRASASGPLRSAASRFGTLARQIFWGGSPAPARSGTRPRDFT